MPAHNHSQHQHLLLNPASNHTQHQHLMLHYTSCLHPITVNINIYCWTLRPITLNINIYCCTTLHACIQSQSTSTFTTEPCVQSHSTSTFTAALHLMPASNHTQHQHLLLHYTSCLHPITVNINIYCCTTLHARVQSHSLSTFTAALHFMPASNHIQHQHLLLDYTSCLQPIKVNINIYCWTTLHACSQSNSTSTFTAALHFNPAANHIQHQHSLRDYTSWLHPITVNINIYCWTTLHDCSQSHSTSTFTAGLHFMPAANHTQHQHLLLH